MQGKANPWEELYNPSRITFDVVGDYMKEVGNMTSQYLDYLTPGDVKSLQDIGPDQGAIVRMGARKIAVYRSEAGEVHAFSAVCPHMGCYVHWNSDEKSFDCPCHGSRFNAYGLVVNGPSTSDLKPIEVRESMLREK